LLEKEEYDILFVDYHLREETGPEALHKIQNHFPNRKFYPVLNTADNKLDSFDVYSKLGFKDILHKDYNKEALENIFKNFYLDTDTISKS
jgi:CheY-like chemotaxis protein